MEAVGEYGGLDLEQTRVVAERGSGYTEFEDGDVVVAKITPCFENGKGALACGLLNGAAIGTTELHVLRPRSNLDRQLLFYFTISPLFRTLGEGEMYGAGGQKRVPTSFCEDVPIPLAPLDEQRAIVDFLDQETAKIGTLIRKKQTLIERLQEKRAALITRTVTSGLPPEAARAAGLEPEPKMKPSGVEWLGEVPAHWEVKRGRFCVEVQPSSNRLRELPPDDEVCLSSRWKQSGSMAVSTLNRRESSQREAPGTRSSKTATWSLRRSLLVSRTGKAPWPAAC